MKLKPVLETLDGLSAEVAALYVKREDGKFALDVEGNLDLPAAQAALKAERDARKAAETKAKEAEDKAKAFDGLDAAEVRELVARFANDEELQLIKAGKTDVLRERWTEKMRKEHEKQLKAAQDALAAEKARGTKYLQRVLDDSLRAAATKVQIHPSAVASGDLLRAGREVFSLDENGNAVQIKDGAVVVGKNGKDPYSPVEWLESMREVAPHWFPATGNGSGASSSGSDGNSGNGARKTMKRAAFDQLDHAQRHATMKEGTLIVD